MEDERSSPEFLPLRASALGLLLHYRGSTARVFTWSSLCLQSRSCSSCCDFDARPVRAARSDAPAAPSPLRRRCSVSAQKEQQSHAVVQPSLETAPPDRQPRRAQSEPRVSPAIQSSASRGGNHGDVRLRAAFISTPTCKHPPGEWTPCMLRQRGVAHKKDGGLPPSVKHIGFERTG